MKIINIGILAHAQAAAVGHDAAGAERFAQRFADALRFLRTVGQIFHGFTPLLLISPYYSTTRQKRKAQNRGLQGKTPRLFFLVGLQYILDK